MTGTGHSPADPPLVSVVTPVLNGAWSLDCCLDSVQEQDYARVEHVVVDGGSRDGTVDILRHRADTLAFWTSAPDAGAAAAFNKGLRAARGDIIGFLNADDWYEPDAVSRAVAALAGTAADFTYGSVAVHGRSGYLGILEPLPPEHWPRESLYQMPVPHITMFVRRTALERIGPFDEGLSCTSDHDQFVRLVAAGCRGVPIGGVVGHIRIGGAADSLRALRESWAIARSHGAPLHRRLGRFGGHFGVYVVRKTARRGFGRGGFNTAPREEERGGGGRRRYSGCAGSCC